MAGDMRLYPVMISKIMDRLPFQVIDYGVRLMNAPKIWRNAKGEGIRIGVIDTGIDPKHPDLQANLLPGFNFVKRNTNTFDDNGHGTHVAGVIAGMDNNIGIVGIAPKAKLVPLKVLDENGQGSVSDVIKAINWSIDNNLDIVNMSFGSKKEEPELKKALKRAWDQGTIIIAAAGNDASEPQADTIDYPGRWEDICMTVAAVDQRKKRAKFSSQGKELFLAAPGVDIYSTYPNKKYTRLSGTSMAAPHIAGAAALLLSSGIKTNGRRDTPEEIRNKMRQQAIDLGKPGFDNDYGYGFFTFN